ncbi:MAG: undecaprenyl/decaprenyl-phosphate alpha-N-acetylglucosaminyl 1-phosphate transferase [Chitinophagaceae bacterium]|nr:undecaprenyl/decaprenyl-phosphate alpha-N-acetylglucosaminyl 1-phosphate transferase [Chitinophagaceae bacterium]
MGVPKGITNELQFFTAAFVVIFFLGLKDDILVISASKKFIGQLVAAGIVIKFGGVLLNNMHGFLGIYEIPYYASVILTFFTIIVITNSFNLIDGVDGLAASLGLLTTIVFGSYFFYVGQVAYAVMALSLAGSIASFLIYNFSPAKIFMGDTGSLLLGIVNSILVIKFINIAGAPGTSLPIHSAPAVGFAILMIPLFDTLRVFGLRILDRRSPFSPDRNHVHHFLLDLGFNHKKTTLICVLVNIGFIIMAFLIRDLGTTPVLSILLVSAFIFIAVIYYSRPKMKPNSREKTSKREMIKPHKLFNLATEKAEVVE